MPTRALRLCAAPGCGEVVESGRCATHARQPWAQVRSRHERGYGSEWERLRKAVLREEGACAYCGMGLLDSHGEPIRGATVDHRVPKCEGGTGERANLCACCSRCQQRKASREGSRGLGRSMGAA